MVLDPPAELGERNGDASAEIGQGVLDMQGYGRIDRPVDEAAALQPAQGLGEALGADTLEPALEAAEALRAVFESADRQRGPFVGQQVEHLPARALGCVDVVMVVAAGGACRGHAA